MAPISLPPRVLSQVLDENDCPTGEMAVNVVVVDYDALGYTLGEDTSSPIVPLYDSDGCAVGWVLKTVQLVEA